MYECLYIQTIVLVIHTVRKLLYLFFRTAKCKMGVREVRGIEIKFLE